MRPSGAINTTIFALNKNISGRARWNPDQRAARATVHFSPVEGSRRFQGERIVRPSRNEISTVDSIYKSAFQTNSRAYNSDQHRGTAVHESVVHSGSDSCSPLVCGAVCRVVVVCDAAAAAERVSRGVADKSESCSALHERRSRGRTRLFYFHFASRKPPKRK